MSKQSSNIQLVACEITHHHRISINVYGLVSNNQFLERSSLSIIASRNKQVYVVNCKLLLIICHVGEFSRISFIKLYQKETGVTSLLICQKVEFLVFRIIEYLFYKCDFIQFIKIYFLGCLSINPDTLKGGGCNAVSLFL